MEKEQLLYQAKLLSEHKHILVISIDMKIAIDHHGFLCVEHPEIPQVKQYTYHVSGYQFSDRDKGMIVLHKKEFKILNLKHVGDGMHVIFVKESKTEIGAINSDVVGQACGLFSAFDEVSGEQKYFWPGARIHPSGILPAPCTWAFTSPQDILSFLYGLTLLYGKFESKNEELLSIKIQIPLFGQYLKYQDNLDTVLSQLQEQGLFLKKDILETNNGIVYQIACNDWEVLEVFAKWHEAIEKFKQISKKAFTEEMKEKLGTFLSSNAEVPTDGKPEVMEKITTGVLKFLTKG